MRTEINLKRKSIDQIYLELEPDGTNEYAPRIGYYRIRRKCRIAFSGYSLYGYEANWKLQESDAFDDEFVIKIQTESLKRNPISGSVDFLNEDNVGRVIHVKHAAKGTNAVGKFIVDWEIISTGQSVVDLLNDLAQQGNYKGMDEAIDSIDVTDISDEDLGADEDYSDY